MTTWDTILDIETATGAIITQDLMRALQYNIRALAEDDASVNALDTLKRFGRQNSVYFGGGGAARALFFDVADANQATIAFLNQANTQGYLIYRPGGTNDMAMFDSVLGDRMRFFNSGRVRVGGGADDGTNLFQVAGTVALQAAGQRFAWNAVGLFSNWIEADGVVGANYIRFGVGNFDMARFELVSGNYQLALTPGASATYDRVMRITSTATAANAGRSFDFYQGAAANPHVRFGATVDGGGTGGIFAVSTSVDLGTTAPVLHFTIGRTGTATIDTVSGATSQSALIMTGATTGAIWHILVNSATSFLIGVEQNAGGAILTGSTGNACVLTSTSTAPIEFGVLQAIKARLTNAGKFECLIATGGIGYGVGAGGTVTQITSKATSVTLDKVTGQITMQAASLAAATSVSFTLANSAIAVTDVVVVNVKSGGTANAYQATISSIAAGSCAITLRNITAGALAEAVVLQFAVIKGSNT